MDLSFLAPPDEVVDWRRVVLGGLATDSGVLSKLPGTPADIAATLELDPHSVRVLLEALAIWRIVVLEDEVYRAGPGFPSDDEARTLQQHARFLRRWNSELGDRLVERLDPVGLPTTKEGLTAWLGALAAGARRTAPGVIDLCLDDAPDDGTLLDVAAGHGEYGIEASRRGFDVTLLDVPIVIDTIRDWPEVASAGLGLIPADVFDHRTDQQFDIVLCFGFTHTQPASRCPALFRQLHELTAPGGTLAVLTFLRQHGHVASLFAVQMLLAGQGGDTHTSSDYLSWLADAGFRTPRIIELDGGRVLLLADRAS